MKVKLLLMLLLASLSLGSFARQNYERNMKIRSLALLVFTILCVCPLFGQVKVGVEAGANLSKFVGNGSSPSEKDDFKAGYQLGVIADYEFRNNLMLMSGLSFIRRNNELKLGLNYTGGSVMAYPKVETKINYLQIPVALGYNFHFAKDISLIPFAGIYVAYGFGAGKCDLDVMDESTSQVTSLDWKPLHGDKEHGLDAFRHWDWGGTAGLKAIINQHYTLAFQYSVGVMKAQTHYGLRNSTFQFSVGYRF